MQTKYISIYFEYMSDLLSQYFLNIILIYINNFYKILLFKNYLYSLK